MKDSTQLWAEAELQRLKLSLDSLECIGTVLSDTPDGEPLRLVIDKPLSEYLLPIEPELVIVRTKPSGEIDGSGI